MFEDEQGVLNIECGFEVMPLVGNNQFSHQYWRGLG
jgi:hypothetical protein